MLADLREKLSRTRRAFQKIGQIFRSGRPREEILEELAEALILADVGVAATEKILDALRSRTRKDDSQMDLEKALKAELEAILTKPLPQGREESTGPTVILMVGVNGGGKTTSTAKLAARFRGAGRKVMMAAADTFRAAAQEQLVLWGRRLDIPVVRGTYGADPASVVFDAVRTFKSQKADVLLIDTAGRVHTKANLMNELEKIRRVAGREIPEARLETFLVLDATTGQNAALQAREFLKVSGLTGIFLTKLDGTAKGGSVIAVVDELGLPVRYIGVGEAEDDLLDFSPHDFVEALLT